MTRLSATTVPATKAPATARRLANLQGTYQRIKPKCKQLIHFRNYATKLGTIKVALHHIDKVLHQQVTLDLHDGGRIGTYKQHDKIITRLPALSITVFVEVCIIKSNLNRRPGIGNFVEIHAHFVEGLAEVFITSNSPAQLQQVVSSFKLDARLILIRTAGPVRQGAATGIFP